jgi:hypothetical protein
MEMNPEKKKPRIRQAGSAEAFLGSAATGRELYYNRQFQGKMQLNLSISRTSSCELRRQISGKSPMVFRIFPIFPSFLHRTTRFNPRPS